MTLEPGARLGPYEIVSQLGQGGMGVVFRARDTRLERAVAVKVLPQGMAGDAEALQRFEREAKAVAALSHPNILAIHDFGHEDGTVYTVTELLEGQTLRQRLQEGALPPRKAVEIALAVAAALASAHERGIVHRDLKPENVFLLNSGHIKVLDFGLAQVGAPLGEGGEGATVSLSTQPGRVMGTVGYMAPEQVRAQPVDARADIFALGAVLYEMLTGKRAFQGDSMVETLNAILREDPPSLLESSARLSPALDRIVRRCLEKRPEERFRSTHDLALALEAVATTNVNSSMALAAAEAGKGIAWGRLAERLALVALGAALALGAAWYAARRAPVTNGMASFRFVTFSGRDASPAVSPDGRTVAFSSTRDGKPRIWIKQAGGEAEAPLTEGPDDFPRFSPDGGELLFTRATADGPGLYRAALVGGETRGLVDDAVEGDWSPDGKQVAFLRLRSENGQTVTLLGLAAVDGTGEREVAKLPGGWRAPRFSPDGATVALCPGSGGLLAGAHQGLTLVDLANGATRPVPAPDARRNLSSAAWTAAGELVYLQAESVVAAAGSAARLVRQDARTGQVLSETWSPASALGLDVLGDGRVVFDTRSPRQNLRELALAAPAPPPSEAGAAPPPATEAPARWLSRGESTDRQPVYSPSGDQVAFSSNRGGGMNLWLVSTATGTLRRVTDSHTNWDPAFTRDGRRLVWSSDRGGNFEIWSADLDGSAARQVTHDGGNAENPTATPDGQWIVYSSGNPQKAGLWKVRADGSQATQLVAGRAALPELSPDGKLVLFRVFSGRYPALIRVAQVEDGRLVPFEIQVEARRRTPVTLGRARWSPDGRAIAFVGQDESGAAGVYLQDFQPGQDTSATRRPLGGFDPDVAAESFGLSPDGRRLVIAGWQQLFSLMEGQGLPGLLAPRRR